MMKPIKLIYDKTANKTIFVFQTPVLAGGEPKDKDLSGYFYVHFYVVQYIVYERKNFCQFLLGSDLQNNKSTKQNIWPIGSQTLLFSKSNPMIYILFKFWPDCPNQLTQPRMQAS